MRTFDEELRNAQGPLLAFLHALAGGSLQTAEHLRSDANIALISKREQYDPARPFLPWAKTIAAYEYKHWISRQQRDRHVFSDATLQLLAQAPAPDDAPTHHETLLRLVDQARQDLNPEMNDLLDRYYSQRQSLAQIGQQLQRTPASLARSLAYIRDRIRAAIHDKLRQQDHD